MTFRISLWKLFYNLNENEIPKFGLTFNNNKYDQIFFIMRFFEKFKEYFVGIDILEKLFIKIIENTKTENLRLMRK